jgi:hypothetical protein
MGKRYRTHLLIKGDVAACGQDEIHSASRRPGDVDCTKCRQSIHMADQEVAALLRRNRNRRKDRP